MKKQVSILLIALASTVAFAQEAPSKLGLVFSFGANLGGDTLVRGTYSNGDSYTIKAGGGTMLSIGATYSINDKMDIQATIGHESDSTDAVNGSIDFKRNPMEVLGFYNINENIRIGAGLRQVSDARLSSSGVASSLGTTDYSASAGTVLEGQYFFAPKSAERKVRVGMFVRFVAEEFTAAGKSVKGDHLGLGVTVSY
jgi:hypothetical protein